ncbi:uncharacterized protein [Ptychodera flava]|uniref:uncharacterized protein n=1 Tax=Ptychodera flava TaxID=63121 RepID=UPI003969FFA3
MLYFADIDECERGIDTCNQTISSCVNTEGSFECGCFDGYRLKDNKTCEDIDECETDNPCDANAYCVNYNGLYTCICNDGYSGYGQMSDCYAITGSIKATSLERNNVNLMWKFDKFESGIHSFWEFNMLHLSYKSLPDFDKTVSLPNGLEGNYSIVNLTSDTGYTISFTASSGDFTNHDKTRNMLFTFNFTDLCVDNPCQSTNQCASHAIIERNRNGSEEFGEWFVCSCPLGLAGSVCDEELLIVIEVINVTATSINIQWHLTDDNYWSRFDDFIIIDVDDGKSDFQRKYVSSTQSSQILSGLKPGTEYIITVIAIGLMHSYNTSNSTVVQLAPQPPVSASEMYDGGSDAIVYWNPGFTEYDNFEVRQTVNLASCRQPRISQ